MEMIRKVIDVGNAIGVTIDSKVVKVLELKQGNLVKISVEKISDES